MSSFKGLFNFRHELVKRFWNWERVSQCEVVIEMPDMQCNELMIA